MKPDEVRSVPAWCLRLFVLVEARAAPRLRTVEGLWRRSTRTRSGRMTDFIRAEELLPAADIDAIIRDAPADLIRFQDVAPPVPPPDRPALAEWLEQFNPCLKEAAYPSLSPNSSPPYTIGSATASTHPHASPSSYHSSHVPSHSDK